MKFASIPWLGFLALSALAAPTVADTGDILWRFDINGTPDLHRPSVAADGTLYWSVNSLYAISPSGQLLWARPYADTSPVAISPNGTLYIGGKQQPPNSHLPALKAFAPNGDHLWDFTNWGFVVGFLGGPAVGPDGNVYAVTYGGTVPNAFGYGAFSLTPSGAQRWHVDGFGNDSGTPTSELVFGNGQVYKAEYNAPMPVAEQQSGLIGIELDGDIAWRTAYGVSSTGPDRHPRVSPLNGNVHAMRQTRTIRTFTPSGSLAWTYNAPYTPTGVGAPAVGPDGSLYVVNGGLHVFSLDAAGGVRWTQQNVLPNTGLAPEVSPDGSLLVIATKACFGSGCPSHLLGLDTSDGSVVFDITLAQVGGVPNATTQPRFSNDGAVVYLGGWVSSLNSSFLLAIEVAGCGSSANYCLTSPNSNGSGAVMGRSGSTSVSANDLVLTATGAAVGRPGIFFYGANPIQQPFGSGFRCVGSPSFRLPVVQTDSSGDVEYALDLSSLPGPAGQISSGDTWHFQFWYRDPQIGGANFNLSDALSATFCD